MEKMVTDTSITKVILICDKAYAVKADGRASGVGTEAQIISAEVYTKQAQDKFVAVIAEKDESGKAYLPVYYKSRIYIDLSEPELYSENFEKLLRWIFNKPLFIKPELGKVPSFITDANATLLGTSALAKRVIEGIKTDKSYYVGALEEYLTVFSENLERFRIGEGSGEIDDRIVKSTEEFLPFRNEFLQVITALSQYSNTITHMPRIHKFFESLATYFWRKPDTNYYNEWGFDNFKFIVHELFLYALAILLRAENFEAATYLTSEMYYISENPDTGRSKTTSYSIFRQYLPSLVHRNQRLNLHRISVRADMLEQRSKTSGLQFRHLMQADFICFIKASLSDENWWPETLLYANRQYDAFEIFARSVSKAYLSKTLKLLVVSDVTEVKKLLEMFTNDRKKLPSYDYETLNPLLLLGIDQWGTKS